MISKARRDANRRWRKKNPEKWRACLRRWRLKNPKKVKAFARKYYLEHSKKLRARGKAYYHEVVKISPEAIRKQRSATARWYRSPAGRAWFARWRKRNRIRQREFVRNWSAKNPDKVRAHRIVSYAIKKGALVRFPCACGSKKSEAHHEDYSRPLDVEWLCRSCHRKKHAAEKK